MSYDGECASLKFISVTPGDEGTYACEAVNELGSAVTNVSKMRIDLKRILNF